MQYVMNFLNTVDQQRRRESRVVNPFAPPVTHAPNGATTPTNPPSDDDVPASPLQRASKLLNDINADQVLNVKNLELMNEQQLRMNAVHQTPPPDRNGNRSGSKAASQPHSAPSESTPLSYSELLDNMVYPVGTTQGIDPAYSEHASNIPYPMPSKALDGTAVTSTTAGRKKSTSSDPGWIRQPNVLLVEDDQTCRRIGGKFLYSFHCTVDSAMDGLEAVNKMNSGAKYDLVLMDMYAEPIPTSSLIF